MSQLNRNNGIMVTTNDDKIVDSQYKQQTDNFEDASEQFLPIINSSQSDEFDLDKTSKRSPEFDLKAQLEETRHVLELALNNQFIRALEICGPR